MIEADSAASICLLAGACARFRVQCMVFQAFSKDCIQAFAPQQFRQAEHGQIFQRINLSFKDDAAPSSLIPLQLQCEMIHRQHSNHSLRSCTA